MSDLPTGTVTFLFTDLEGSTRLWEEHPEAMRAALARHDEILRDSVEKHDGHVVKTTGDGLHAAFAVAPDAVAAALDAQRGLVAEEWVLPESLRVRMGVHVGAAELRDGDYFGPAVNRAARVAAAANGGQILVSLVTEELVRDDVPAEASLVDLGEHALRDVERPERVFQLSHPAITAKFPRLQTDERVSGNLPDARDTFVGRTRELADLDASLTLTPLVTLTGVGGVGKTRLALETARRAEDRFADGAWLVELAPVTDAALVGAVVAAALGVRERPGEPVLETLRAWAARRQALLLLDNCEHVLAAVARLVDALVAAAPALRVIATSREALGIPGEQTRPVPSLEVPRTEDVTIDHLRAIDSIALFADRARHADPTFEIDDTTAAAVVQICRRLDGIPLAIELAAARVRAMDPGEIARRLDERFRLLTGGSRTALERHQTLRAALDWSYDLLDPAERMVFDRLSVFRGGFTLDATEHVAVGDGVDEREVVDVVIRLVEKSLVFRDPATARYDLLETMRVYGRDHLVESGDAANTRERHAAAFIAFAETHEPRRWAADTWERERDELFADFDNIHEAFDWMLESGASERALGLYLGLGMTWSLASNPRDTLQELQVALQASELLPAVRARALAQAARAAFLAGDPTTALALALESEQVADTAAVSVPAAAVGARGCVAMYDDDDAGAMPLLERCLELARAEDDVGEISMALALLAQSSSALGDHRRAIDWAEESIRIGEEVSGASTRSPASWAGRLALGETYRSTDPARARECMEQCYTISVETSRFAVTNSNLIGAAALRLGQFEAGCAEWRAAGKHLREALSNYSHFGGNYGIAAAFEGLAGVAASLEHPEPGARMLGAADRIRAAIGAKGRHRDVEARTAAIASLTEALRADTLERIRAEGKALAGDDAIALALAETDFLEHEAPPDT